MSHSQEGMCSSPTSKAIALYSRFTMSRDGIPMVPSRNVGVTLEHSMKCSPSYISTVTLVQLIGVTFMSSLNSFSNSFGCRVLTGLTFRPVFLCTHSNMETNVRPGPDPPGGRSAGAASRHGRAIKKRDASHFAFPRPVLTRAPWWEGSGATPRCYLSFRINLTLDFSPFLFSISIIAW